MRTARPCFPGASRGLRSLSAVLPGGLAALAAAPAQGLPADHDVLVVGDCDAAGGSAASKLPTVGYAVAQPDARLVDLTAFDVIRDVSISATHDVEALSDFGLGGGGGAPIGERDGCMTRNAEIDESLGAAPTGDVPTVGGLGDRGGALHRPRHGGGRRLRRARDHAEHDRLDVGGNDPDAVGWRAIRGAVGATWAGEQAINGPGVLKAPWTSTGSERRRLGRQAPAGAGRRARVAADPGVGRLGLGGCDSRDPAAGRRGRRPPRPAAPPASRGRGLIAVGPRESVVPDGFPGGRRGPRRAGPPARSSQGRGRLLPSSSMAT